MGKVTEWKGRLEIINDKLCLTITAVHESNKGRKHKELDVYREYDDGTAEGRNMYYNMYCGLVVKFPGEKYGWYYGYGNVTEEVYGGCRVMSFGAVEIISVVEKKLIAEKYPEFAKYVLPSIPLEHLYIQEVLQILVAWKEHKEVEYLVKSGYFKCIKQKSFWKMSKNMSKKVTYFMRKNPGLDFKLRDIQLSIRENITPDEVLKYRRSCCSNKTYKVYKYIQKQRVNFDDSEYRTAGAYDDYIKMLNRSAHNPSEEYWKFPSDLKKFHDDLLSEEDKERAARLAAEIQKLKKRAARWPRIEIGGYEVFASSNPDEWILQAHELHQCIVTCSYDKKMANGYCDILFIRKDNKPVATVELFKMTRIGQFYADEHSGTPAGSLPTDEVREVFNEYLKQCEEMRKAKKNKRKVA